MCKQEFIDKYKLVWGRQYRDQHNISVKSNIWKSLDVWVMFWESAFDEIWARKRFAETTIEKMREEMG